MPYQKDTGFVFGTVYNIIYQNDKSLKQDIEAELKKGGLLALALQQAINHLENKPQ